MGIILKVQKIPSVNKEFLYILSFIFNFEILFVPTLPLFLHASFSWLWTEFLFMISTPSHYAQFIPNYETLCWAQKIRSNYYTAILDVGAH